MKKGKLLNFSQFKQEAKEKGIRYLLKEVTDYKDLEINTIYAVKNRALIGCYGKKTGGVFYKVPKKQWNSSGRKFTKIKV